MANVKTRIIQKHDSSANWAKATTFVPLKGEIIIYDDLGKIKIGDGATKVNDLQFLDKDAVKQVKLNNVAKTPNTDGVVDLGTVITAHQDISGKVNTSTTIAGKPLTSNISAADLRKALNVADGANQTIVDDSFDSTSINPVQNKVITGMFENFIGIQLVGPNSTSIETDLMSLNRQVSIDESIYNRIRNLHHTYMTSGAPCNTYIYLGSINVFAFAGVHGDTFNFITLNDHGYDEADIYLLRIFPDNTAIVTSVQNQFNSKYAAESELASYVTRNGSETITGQKTFSQTGSYAPLSVINNSSTEDEEELIIKSGRLTHYYADSTYCEILNLPYKGGVDPEEYTLATTDDLVQAYEKITRSTSSLTNTSYNTMWTAKTLNNANTSNIFKKGRTVIFQVTSGPYNSSTPINKSIFIWYLSGTLGTQDSWGFCTETSTSSSSSSFGIDGAVYLGIGSYGNSVIFNLKGRNANSTPIEFEYWVLGE